LFWFVLVSEKNMQV